MSAREQNTITEILEAEDTPGVALGTNIDTHVHVGHLAGVDFSGFSRELVRTVLGPVSDVGFDGAVRPRAAVASPPKSISVTPRLLDRCHRSRRDLLVRVNISRCSQYARSIGIRTGITLETAAMSISFRRKRTMVIFSLVFQTGEYLDKVLLLHFLHFF